MIRASVLSSHSMTPLPPMPGARDEVTNGWSIRSRIDEAGRTLYSIYIGNRLVVQDALNSDAAVIAARRWIQVTRTTGRRESDDSGISSEAEGAVR